MRYTLIDNDIEPVNAITHEGRRISNPSDELIDELKAGYPLVETPEPEYDKETQYIVLTYSFDGNKITQKWEIKNIPGPEPGNDLEKRITALEEENAALREAIEAGVNM